MSADSSALLIAEGKLLLCRRYFNSLTRSRMPFGPLTQPALLIGHAVLEAFAYRNELWAGIMGAVLKGTSGPDSGQLGFGSRRRCNHSSLHRSDKLGI